MSSVIEYYTGFGEREWCRLEREPLEFLVNWHYIDQYLPPQGHILDNGAGPGKYSMMIAKRGLKVTLTDLTPRLVEIAKSKADEYGVNELFEGFHVADACDLSMFSDETFDASLMLGPLYHLQQENERVRAVKELCRVTRKGGYVFVAFRSRINHALVSLLNPEHWKPNNTMDAISQFLETGIFNHSDDGRFTGAYFYDIGDINPFMESHGFESIELLGSTNIGVALTEEKWNYWSSKGDHNKLEVLLIETARNPYVLGISSHVLYIGKKPL